MGDTNKDGMISQAEFTAGLQQGLHPQQFQSPLASPSRIGVGQLPLDGPVDAQKLWVLTKEGEPELLWQGPFTASELLRLAERAVFSQDALICGLTGPPIETPQKAMARPLFESFPALGAAARRESEG